MFSSQSTSNSSAGPRDLKSPHPSRRQWKPVRSVITIIHVSERSGVRRMRGSCEGGACAWPSYQLCACAMPGDVLRVRTYQPPRRKRTIRPLLMVLNFLYICSRRLSFVEAFIMTISAALFLLVWAACCAHRCKCERKESRYGDFMANWRTFTWQP